jgi:hypothetical protein
MTAQLIRFPGHKWAHCTSPDCHGCMLCLGGLGICSTCGGGEGALPDHCPGVPMTMEQTDAVYEARLNYRDGQWREEPSRVWVDIGRGGMK